ncbi:hypothetical protein [Zhihengliuella flava]|uniref:Uncharacterized protein n=1 Tax=Zhihengliuella flava TaxID=1285193 RepID=A0A931DB19_9MICC|nr:hypothetical protein [Zhihengliuella flava]MBG6085182.1 hypothetical protein [Zhihengliuella flava]
MSENRIAELGTEAHDDLNRLLGTSLGIAREQLEAHGVFLPFAVGLSTESSDEGEMRLLAVQPPEDTENPEADIDADVMMKDLTELLTQQKEDFKAVAMISDVTLLETGGDAIHAAAEHSAGGAVAVVQAYTPPSPEADEPVWTFDEPATEASELKIWD